MANSIANLDLSFMGSTALNVGQEKVIPFDVFTTRYVEGELESDVVKVYPLASPQTATAWNDSSNNYTDASQDSETAIDVTLNQRFKSAFELSADDFRRIGASGLQMKINSYVNEIARQAQVNMLSVITNANFGAAVHTGAASTLDVDAIGTINANSDIQKWTVSPKMNMVLKPTYYQNVVTEASIVNVNQRGGDDANRSGLLATPVLGWDMYQLNSLPDNSQNLTGFCTDGRGVVGAFAVKSDWDDKQTYFSEVFVDPNTNFTYRMTITESSATHNKLFHFESLYGFAAGQTDGLKRIVSA